MLEAFKGEKIELWCFVNSRSTTLCSQHSLESVALKDGEWNSTQNKHEKNEVV
jgi:hypothetical protein